MTDDKTRVTGAGSVLRGNYDPRGGNDPNLTIEKKEKSASVRSIEEFEAAAREKIGGSIAFVTRLRDPSKDPLFYKGEDD